MERLKFRQSKIYVFYLIDKTNYFTTVANDK